MKIKDSEVAKKMINLQQSAESRGHEFNLSFRTVKRLLLVKTCYYTKLPFVERVNDDFERTIDRLDNSKGYVEGNVVACAKYINALKGKMNLSDILAIYNGIKRLYKK